MGHTTRIQCAGEIHDKVQFVTDSLYKRLEWRATESMRMKYFLNVSACILVVTALAKLYGLTYGEQVLQQPDPLFGVKNSVVMLLVSVAELWVVYLVLSATQSVTKLVALAWISSNFLPYRFGLYMVGFKGWCSCLGTLTKQLPVSPETAEAIMLTIAVFVFIGSCYYLLPYVKSRTMSQES